MSPILSLHMQLPSPLILLPWYFSHWLLLPFLAAVRWFRSSLLPIWITGLPTAPLVLPILSPWYCQNGISKINFNHDSPRCLQNDTLTSCVTVSKLLNTSCLYFLICKMGIIIVPLRAVANI